MSIKAIAAGIGVGAFASLSFVYCFFSQSSSVDEKGKDRKLIAHHVLANAKSSRRESRIKVQPSQTVMPENMSVDPTVEIGFLKADDKKIPVDDERTLNALASSLLSELRNAVETGDLDAVREVIAKIYSKGNDELGADKYGSVPRFLKKRIIEALSSFGSAGVLDLIGQLADEDPVIAQYATTQFEQALMDLGMSDAERSDIVSAAARQLTNESLLKKICWEINNMRHSRGVATIIDICQNGTPEAQKTMPEIIKFFTSDAGVETIEDLQIWLENHPDSKFDEALYGGLRLK